MFTELLQDGTALGIAVKGTVAATEVLPPTIDENAIVKVEVVEQRVRSSIVTLRSEIAHSAIAIQLSNDN